MLHITDLVSVIAFGLIDENPPAMGDIVFYLAVARPMRAVPSAI
jgi:hypothetical protein